MRKGLLLDMMALHASMKDYDALKKKLENRRLDYDAKLNKFNKSKKEKPGLEEEMKTAQKKYNETLADLESLMSTFAEREVGDCSTFPLGLDLMNYTIRNSY